MGNIFLNNISDMQNVNYTVKIEVQQNSLLAHEFERSENE